MPPDEINSMKLAINDLENQVENLTKTVTELVTELKAQAATRVEKAKEWATLKNQHETLMQERAREKTWISGRMGGLVDKLLPIIIGGSIMFFLMKGGKL